MLITMGITEIAIIIVLILSIVLHEVAHGYAANWLGDPTARLAGRLTANPLPHIDPLGSVVLPAILFLTHSPFLFGWAKPVPVNLYNLRNQKWGGAIVAAAGPFTNIFLAVIFAILVRLAVPLQLSPSFITLAASIVQINVLLAVFNLIPFPPLDGSKMIDPFLPHSLRMQLRSVGTYLNSFGMIGMLLFLFVFVTVLSTPFYLLIGYITSRLLGIQ